VRGADGVLAVARAEAAGTGGARIVDTVDRFNRRLAANEPLRRFIAQERDAGLRILASDTSLVRAAMVERFVELIDEQVVAAGYAPPVEPAALAYAAVRLTEAFLYYDVRPGIRDDVSRLREVLAPLLGVPLS
jgi:hypothetical protein